jgi:hypothetical protein
MQLYNSREFQINPFQLKLNRSNHSFQNTRLNYVYYNCSSFKSVLYNQFNYNPTINYFFIYDVVNTPISKEERVLDGTRLTEHNDDNITIDIHAQLPLFFINKDLIKIPKKVEYVIRKYISRNLLKEIHADIDIAIELCLLFTSQLSSTHFGIIEGSNPDGWKSLKSECLRDFLSLHPMTYKRVITALQYPLKNGAVLECDCHYQVGQKNYFYRLGKPYIGKGIINYQLKTNEAKVLLNKYYYKRLDCAQKNPICKNLIMFYSDVTLPTIEQIKKEANRLIKLEYITKKGKRLTKRNKHSRTYFKNPENLSFMEDSIDIFSYLTDNGLMIPTVGNEKSGCRIVDSFTLMPSWIRRLVKVRGKQHIECDYSCLHPNIAVELYNGTKSHLTHGDIGLALKIDSDLVKTEHLSFFNKSVWQMKQSPIFSYYKQNESKMLENIIKEKNNSPFRHRITSRRLFAKEVEIMTQVIEELNKENIYVGYIYDALFCHPKQAKRVKEIMDTAIQSYNVQTTAKLSSGKKHNPIVARIKEEKLDLDSIVNPSQHKEETLVCLQIDARDINYGHGIKNELLERIHNGEVLNFVDADIIYTEDYILRERVLKIYDMLNSSAPYVMESYILDSEI